MPKSFPYGFQADSAVYVIHQRIIHHPPIHIFQSHTYITLKSQPLMTAPMSYRQVIAPRHHTYACL